MAYPQNLVDRLRWIAYDLLPMPVARVDIMEMMDGDGEPYTVKTVTVEPELASQAVAIDPEAWAQWERYTKATTYDMLPENPSAIPLRYYSPYGRFGTTVIKLAMILATFDAQRLPVRVEPPHVYRAQEIVERWRDNLHTILARCGDVEADAQAEEVKAALAENGRNWTSRRDLLRTLNKRWSELEPIIGDMEQSGELERQERKGNRGPASEEYRLVVEG